MAIKRIRVAYDDALKGNFKAPYSKATMKHYNVPEGETKLIGRTKRGYILIRMKDPIAGKYFDVEVLPKKPKRKHSKH